MSTNESRIPENIEGLMEKFLLVQRKGEKITHQEKEIRKWIVSKVIESRGDKSQIGFFVQWAFSQIAANNLGGISSLVADVIKIWPTAYPGDEIEILEAIPVNASRYIRDGRMGEGIIIAMLELVNEGKSTGFETLVFKYLFRGDIVSCLRDSSITKYGKGRITNALSVFVSGVWNQYNKHAHQRLALGMLLIRRLRSLVHTSSALIFPDLTHQDSDNVLGFFADELSAKLFLESSFGMRSFIVCSYLKHTPNSPLDGWLARFPEFECADPV